jgi:signal transduction histidine kinase
MSSDHVGITVEQMAFLDGDWATSERPKRALVATVGSFIGVWAIVTRGGDIVDISLITPAIAVFWIWATTQHFPRWPVYLAGISVPIVVNLIEAQDEVSMFLLVLSVALITVLEDRRELVALAIVGTGLTILVLGSVGALGGVGWPNWLFGIAFAWGSAEIVYRYSRTIAELEQTRALVADQAANDERRRIARDVHDLVGHSLSVVMLHLTGARLLVRKDPDEAERALAQAEAAGRQSLAEIRRTVGLLRDDSDSSDPAMPSPDLTDVASLVAGFTEAGLEVELSTHGPVGDVGGPAALAGYRIVQEALTNISRHTVGARALVSVSVQNESFDVAVQNHGGETIDTGRGSGFGLVSMRERAKSAGGSLIAGPTPSGWTVEATLPMPTSGVHE